MKRHNENKKIDAKTVIAAVDLGKTTHWGYLRCTGKDIKPFSFSNNIRGFEKWWTAIEEFRIKNNLEKIIFGVESTGSYGDPLKFFMQQKKAIVLQVNPMHTKRLKELSDNSPNKTDKKDPRIIADILMLGYGLSSVMPSGLFAELRENVTGRENRTEDINRVKNRIESLLARHFPEYLKIMSLRTKTGIYILKKYSTAEAISELELNSLTEEIYRVSKSQIRHEKVRKLHQAAINTIGLREGQQAYTKEVRRLIGELELLEQQLAQIETEIKEIVEQLPEYRILRSVKGLGFVTSAYLLSEIVDFNLYSFQKEIKKYAGLNLYEISSGQHRGQRRLSKRGRTLLRKALFMSAISMIKHGGIYNADYQKYVNRGMAKIKAIVIIMKKLLGMVFSLVKRNQMFVDNYKQAA